MCRQTGHVLSLYYFFLLTGQPLTSPNLPKVPLKEFISAGLGHYCVHGGLRWILSQSDCSWPPVSLYLTIPQTKPLLVRTMHFSDVFQDIFIALMVGFKNWVFIWFIGTDSYTFCSSVFFIVSVFTVCVCVPSHSYDILLKHYFLSFTVYKALYPMVLLLWSSPS